MSYHLCSNLFMFVFSFFLPLHSESITLVVASPSTYAFSIDYISRNIMRLPRRPFVCQIMSCGECVRETKRRSTPYLRMLGGK